MRLIFLKIKRHQNDVIRRVAIFHLKESRRVVRATFKRRRVYAVTRVLSSFVNLALIVFLKCFFISVFFGVLKRLTVFSVFEKRFFGRSVKEFFKIANFFDEFFYPALFKFNTRRLFFFLSNLDIFYFFV